LRSLRWITHSGVNGVSRVGKGQCGFKTDAFACPCDQYGRHGSSVDSNVVRFGTASSFAALFSAPGKVSHRIGAGATRSCNVHVLIFDFLPEPWIDDAFLTAHSARGCIGLVSRVGPDVRIEYFAVFKLEDRLVDDSYRGVYARRPGVDVICEFKIVLWKAPIEQGLMGVQVGPVGIYRDHAKPLTPAKPMDRVLFGDGNIDWGMG